MARQVSPNRCGGSHKRPQSRPAPSAAFPAEAALRQAAQEPAVRRWVQPNTPSPSVDFSSQQYLLQALAYQNQLLAEISQSLKALLPQQKTEN